MRLKREFLGWSRPAIESAASYLLERFHVSGLVDLTRVAVIVPTRRSGRRLREVLLQRVEEQRLAMFPPQITTVGTFPELLYEPRLPFASPLVQHFAWVQALQRVSKSALQNVLPQAPLDQTDPRWHEVAALLRRQHYELAAEQLDFQEVAKRGATLNGFTDGPRWRALAKIQKEYWKIIDSQGYWDRQKARNVAVEGAECRFDGFVVLLGLVDLHMTLRKMLSQISEQVTALIYAPRSMADRFDGFGCVDPDRWQNESMPIEQRHVLIADGPGNQAEGVVQAIASFAGTYAADELAIGVPDATIVPHIQNKLDQVGLRSRWGPGRSLEASRPVQWLRIVAEYLATERYDAFAELMRHADTVRFLYERQNHGDGIRKLDRYFARHLPNYIRTREPVPKDLPEGAKLVWELLQPLAQARRSPQGWAEPVRDLLWAAFGSQKLDPRRLEDRTTLSAAEQLHGAIERLRELSDRLIPPVESHQVILMVLDQISDEEVSAASEPGSIEMVGWLDLPLDDAKAVIVTSMNEGVVPQGVTSDLLMPNQLRQALGIDDNARRYARDAYALTSLLESRMAVRFIVGRRNSTGDPLRPSRLIMAVRREELATHCLRLFAGETDVATFGPRIDRESSQFEIPRPRKLVTPITSMSVSDFNNYLDCPFRFYLKKVLRIAKVDDRADELDAPTFGTLAHDVLEAFARSEFCDTAEPEEIRQYLVRELQSRSKEIFGRQPRATVQVQLAQLQSRLSIFANAQADWRLQGWQITPFVEHELPAGGVPLMVDGEPIQLRGRIDRIDYHTELQRYAVLDYKTGDAGESPVKKHIRKQGDEPLSADHWINLQLPLYRHLAAAMGIKGPVELGYVLLPSDPKMTKFELVQWTEEELQVADEAAANVVRRIRAEQFWPPTDPSPYAHDDFASICQQGVFGRQRFSTSAQSREFESVGEELTGR